MAAGGEVIVSGRVTLDAFEIFDPAAGAWQVGPALPHPVHGVGGAAIDDRFLLPGGSSEAGAIVNAGFTQVYAP
jgi:hypothetical protein